MPSADFVTSHPALAFLMLLAGLAVTVLAATLVVLGVFELERWARSRRERARRGGQLDFTGTRL